MLGPPFPVGEKNTHESIAANESKMKEGLMKEGLMKNCLSNIFCQQHLCKLRTRKADHSFS